MSTPQPPHPTHTHTLSHFIFIPNLSHTHTPTPTHSLEEVMEYAEDIEIDIPKFWDYLAQLLSHPVSDPSLIPLSLVTSLIPSPLVEKGKVGVLATKVGGGTHREREGEGEGERGRGGGLGLGGRGEEREREPTSINSLTVIHIFASKYQLRMILALM